MTREDILAIARPLYADDGPNQWPHIMRVLSQGEKLAEARGRKLTNPEFAAILLHDAAKHNPDYSGIDHGVAGGMLTRKLLEGKLRPRTLSAIANAISQHNFDKKPNSKLADLLMSADANIPNLPWFLRKSYNKVRTEYGYSDKDALHNAYVWAKKGTPLLQSKRYKPGLWQELFKDDIRATEKAIADLKLNQVKRMIREYTKAHPSDSSYV